MLQYAMFLALFASTTVLQAGTLTSQEIKTFHDVLGADLTTNQIEQLGQILKPDQPWPAWRSNAVERIEQYRKADIEVHVVDKDGIPIPDAKVRVVLRRNAFNFGGIININYWYLNSGYQSLACKMFNAVGLENKLKPKWEFDHRAVSRFFDWAQANSMPVRGHLIIWSAAFNMPDGSPYPQLDAYNAIKSAQNRSAPPEEIASLRSNLIAVTDFMVKDWASRWPVYEWDVINEPHGKHEIEDILEDYGQDARWFQIAKANSPLPDCKMMINENQVISTGSSGSFIPAAQRYQVTIDRIDNGGGHVDRIGFQSRFKYGHIDPAIVNDRLAYFENVYPDKELVGTEFEIKNEPDEFVRAQMTEEIMTSYFSHRNVSGLNAWTFLKTDERALFLGNGTAKLNGLVWYYLHRMRYVTDESVHTGFSGSASVRGFKGLYEVAVDFNDQTYASTFTLSTNQTVTVQLPDISIPELLYAKWIDSYQNTVSHTNMLDDADGDGACNLSEYAAGSAPDNPGSRPEIKLRRGGSSQLLCIYPKRNDAVSRQLVYRLERKTNLLSSVSWQTNGIITCSSTNLTMPFLSITNIIPVGNAPHEFYRLRIQYRKP
jgi:GH35 family endo-1,4-beta-xylanase